MSLRQNIDMIRNEIADVSNADELEESPWDDTSQFVKRDDGWRFEALKARRINDLHRQVADLENEARRIQALIKSEVA